MDNCIVFINYLNDRVINKVINIFLADAPAYSLIVEYFLRNNKYNKFKNMY
jgi:hypothetical protein